MGLPVRFLPVAFSLGLLLSSCAAPMSEEEEAFSTSMTRDLRPESRTARDDIERQDVLAQAAFWAKEYDTNPADREAAVKLARIVRTIGNPGRAAAIGNQALALFPDDRDLLLITGQALIEDGHAENAISFLKAALRNGTDDGSALSALGVAYDMSDRHSMALETFAKALAAHPNDPKILSNIGISHALQGDPVAAEKWLRRAVAQIDADPQVRQNLALVLSLQGRFDEAEALAAKDVSDGMAQANVDYIKSMVTRPQAWQELRHE